MQAYVKKAARLCAVFEQLPHGSATAQCQPRKALWTDEQPVPHRSPGRPSNTASQIDCTQRADMAAACSAARRQKALRQVT